MQAAKSLYRIRHWLNRVMGIDAAVAFTIVGRGWSAVVGVVMLALIVRFLTPTEQGYYYTLWSLVALQIVFELGFFTVILQLAAHEAAMLRFDRTHSISGDEVAHRRLASVVQWSMRWYAVAAVLMTVILLPAGIRFFSNHPQPGPPVNWLVPWCAAVGAIAFKFQVDPLLSILEGCGFVAQVARVRMSQAVVASALGCLTLVSGYGMYAPALYILGQGIAGAAWLVDKRRLVLGLLVKNCRDDRVRWQEIWPFQWRIAVSWLSGYFTFQLFNPVMFTYWGAAAAGQIGMALNIVNAISSITIAWISTKAAVFGGLIARKQYAELDRLFFQTLKKSVLLCVLICVVVLLGDFYLCLESPSLANRLVEPLSLAMLLCIPVLNQIASAQALYLRAHKHERFMPLSVAGALCVGSSTFFLGRSYGAIGMSGGYLFFSVLIGLLGGTLTFIKYRRLWHQ